MSREFRPVHTIAQDIKDNWKNVYFGAIPYLTAMMSIESIDDMYGVETAKGVVQGFLANAMYWRGEHAKRIKAELKIMVE